MTTPIERDALAAANGGGAHAAPSQPAQQASTRWGRIHHDITGFGHALLHMAPVLERIATNPLVDELVEAALQADGLGVEAQAFHAAIDALTGASKRKQMAQPVFLPAPAADGSEAK